MGIFRFIYKKEVVEKCINLRHNLCQNIQKNLYIYINLTKICNVIQFSNMEAENKVIPINCEILIFH